MYDENRSYHQLRQEEMAKSKNSQFNFVDFVFDYWWLILFATLTFYIITVPSGPSPEAKSDAVDIDGMVKIATECPRAVDYFRHRLNDDKQLTNADLEKAIKVCKETQLLEVLNR